VLDCLPYIDVMRNMKSVPILVVTPEFANMEQMEQTVQYLREVGMSSERMNTIQSRTFINGDLYISKDERVVRVRGVEIDLTAKEFDILVLLSFNPRRVFTYEMISDIVWNEEYNEYSRKAINNHISDLRKKLKVTPDMSNYIKSVHSVGYKLEPQE
jgi:DNA-binding response OmpR family regulator